jgi:hypothetical protein
MKTPQEQLDAELLSDEIKQLKLAAYASAVMLLDKSTNLEHCGYPNKSNEEAAGLSIAQAKITIERKIRAYERKYPITHNQ